MQAFNPFETLIEPTFVRPAALQHFPANAFPTMHPVHWLHSHFAVGGWSPLQRLSGMLTAHMTQIAPHNGFTWHPHRGLEIFTWILEGTLYHEDTTGGKGEIGPGELQRMFSGDYIEHMEMNYSDEPVRVIQIWYVADRRYRGLEPHYQQITSALMPQQTIGNATVYTLIGDDSPMEHHVAGRLTAASVPTNGTTSLVPPHEDEDLFVYFTDGTGSAEHDDQTSTLGQYDVMLANADAPTATIRAGEQGLNFLSFYLPKFLDI